MKKDNEYTKELEKLKENIRKIRKDNGYRSAESFAEALGISLKTVQGWENLDNGRWPDLVMMLKVCELTGIDLDRLLGRIQEPTHDIKFICEKTGLSVGAIEKLISLKGTGMDEMLSIMLEHQEIDKLFSSIRMAVDEAEMWWAGLLGVAPSGSADDAKQIADFMVSKRFLKVVDDVREQFEKLHGSFVKRFSNWSNLLKIRSTKEKLAEIFGSAENEEQLDEVLAQNDRMTNEQRQKIKDLWKLYDSDGGESFEALSLAEWISFAKEVSL